MIILEKRRSEILAKSRLSNKGKERIQKKNKSRISTSVRGYNKIDVNKLFKDDILDITIEVQGETSIYQVDLSFEGVVKNLKELLKSGQKLDYRLVYKACMTAFNNSNLFMRCSCPDSQYRMQYWQSKNDVIKGNPETRPSNITNPHDSLGNACKHELLILANLQWMQKVASVIKNYITYTEEHYKGAYERVLYPILYDKPYEDNQELDQSAIGKHQDNRDEKGRFQRTNTNNFILSNGTTNNIPQQEEDKGDE